jgi:hypothetical protein
VIEEEPVNAAAGGALATSSSRGTSGGTGAA